jgi:hypothetical protein
MTDANTANAIAILLSLSNRGFIGRTQQAAIRAELRGEENKYFVDMLDKLNELIERMPKTYEQSELGEQAIVYLHYFSGSADAFITERDSEQEQHQAFGLMDLFEDGGELGYISLSEITEGGMELDLYWTPKTLAEVRKERS